MSREQLVLLVLSVVGLGGLAIAALGYARRRAHRTQRDVDGPRARRDSRIPVTPLSIDKRPTPVAPAPPSRSKSASIAPPLGRPGGTSLATAAPLTIEPPPSHAKSRAKAPSQQLVPVRTRPPSAAPVDVALRLGNAPLDLPVEPSAAPATRKRTPSAGPIPLEALPPEVGLVLRNRPPSVAPPPAMPSVAAALADAASTKLRGRVSYAVTSAAFSGTGITAHREDGFAKLVKWHEVVGIVARRLPAIAPYDGAPFVDVVSSAGATLRLLPWTEISGHELGSTDPVERARAIIQLLVARCLDAKLDGATSKFVHGAGPPAQLPDEKTLAAHDKRLA